MEIVAIVGVLTALMAASIGLVQNDIKRVLAYSTVSQLGYMFTAMGVGAFSAGAFHLMTHAFFKALLFLGSGSVIHAMGGEQDMRRMGGLKKYMPVTFVTMMIGTLAIAGIPPFAGFFSKDEILFRAFLSNKVDLGARGGHRADDGVLHVPPDVDDVLRRATAGRRGRRGARRDGDAAAHGVAHPADRARARPGARGDTRSRTARAMPHATTDGGAGTATARGTGRTSRRRAMTFPLMALAVGAIVAGFVGIPAALGGGNAIEHFLEPSFTASRGTPRRASRGCSAGRSRAAQRPQPKATKPSRRASRAPASSG